MAGLEDILLRRRQPLDERAEWCNLGSLYRPERANGDWVAMSGCVTDQERYRFLFRACVVDFVFVRRRRFGVEQVGNKDIWSSRLGGDGPAKTEKVSKLQGCLQLGCALSQTLNLFTTRFLLLTRLWSGVLDRPGRDASVCATPARFLRHTLNHTGRHLAVFRLPQNVN